MKSVVTISRTSSKAPGFILLTSISTISSTDLEPTTTREQEREEMREGEYWTRPLFTEAHMHTHRLAGEPGRFGRGNGDLIFSATLGTRYF